MKTGFGAQVAATECTHPPHMRSTLHGFGQKANDVTQFFCRGCQQHIDIVDRGAQVREQALSRTE